MKPILENWNRFINEQETMFFGGVGVSEDGEIVKPKKKIKIKLKEIFEGEAVYEDGGSESSYFGKIVKIANEIKQIHTTFLKDLEKMFQRPPSSFIQYVRPLTVDNVNNEIQFFADEVEKQTEAKLIGCGKFRCVFDVNDEYVIKIDVTPRGSAKEQNETDARLGREGYGNLFAKSYLADKDHSWVILEKVKPFKRSDIYDFISYFPNRNINLKGYPAFHYALVVISFTYHKGLRAAAQNKLNEISKSKRIQIPDQIPDLEIIADGFTQHNPYDKIIRVITELGIRPEEVRVLNTGVGVDGRFVIIDSSLEEEIKKGFEEPSKPSQKPSVPAGTTIKVD